MSSLDVVIPVYNEELCLRETIKRLMSLKDKLLSKNYKTNFIFINDGSLDNTYQILKLEAKKDKTIKLINLSRNFGHQVAMTAGINNSEADYVAIIDADLQDPPELIEDMLSLMKKENLDVVYGERTERDGETFFKKSTAYIFYYILDKLCDVKIPRNTGDFRLITKRVVDHLKIMPESDRFTRGLIPWIGYNSKPLKYKREKRFAGVTSYPFNKMLKLALDAVLSFSNLPIRYASIFGLLITFIGIISSFYILYVKIFDTERILPGMTTTMISIFIIGGFQIAILGLIGEYVGRLYKEVKKRPLYIIDEKINY